MEFEEKEVQKLDLFVFLDDFLKVARRHLLLALVLAVVLGGIMTARSALSYAPVYTASASFSVKVANPLYAGTSAYNTATAEQMAKTFPHVLTSGVLQERVKEHLGISYMPSVSVTANTNGSVITMKVTDGDPQRAWDVLKAVMEYYPEIAEFVVGSTRLVLLDESGVPTVPVNQRDLKTPALQGVVIGLALWAVYVVFLSLTKNTVHSEAELKRMLNTPCMGQVPSVKLNGRKNTALLYKAGHHQGFSESIRLLRMHVEKAMTEQKKKVLLVSSAIPGEGKTTISSNLAISLARKGKRVLIVDCDLRNPSVAKTLSVESILTLDDYLQGWATFENIITPTKDENLFAVSGGSGTRTSPKYQSHALLTELIGAVRDSFDIVILDTPPCSLLADASEYASMADCGLMVVRQDYASREQILDGIQRLGDGNLPLIGCVINHARRSSIGGYNYGYGYGYSYGYNRGYGYGEKKK